MLTYRMEEGKDGRIFWRRGEKRGTFAAKREGI